MKQILFLLLAAVVAPADELNSKLVPANTRWLLHVDAEAFRKTKIGPVVGDQKFDKFIEQAERELKVELDFSFAKITALTAFGARADDTAEREGVLIVQTTADVRGDLEKLIAIKSNGAGSVPTIVKSDDGGVEVYTVGGDLRLVQASDTVWLLGKSRTTLSAAREVVLGKAPALGKSDLLNYPAVKNSFFFLAAADTSSAGALPAQAKILQKAEGGRIVIGEHADRLFITGSLRSKEPETITQIQQVAQGLLALAALSAGENKDLAALTSSASVTATDNIVSVNLSFPLDRAIQKVREEK